MKTSLIPFAALLLSSALAHPLAEDAPATAITTTTHSYDLATTHLEKRDECANILGIANAIGTSKAVVAWAIIGGNGALYVCKKKGWQDCGPMSYAVTAGIALIFDMLGRDGAIAARDDTPQDLASYLSSVLTKEGYEFSEVSSAGIAFTESASDVKQPKEAVNVRGLKFENETLDLDVVDFGNGEGHVYMPMLEDATNDSGIRKRVDGAGFKISYTERLRSQLSQPHRRDMSGAIAQNWVYAVNHRNIKDYIGFVETEHTANFYFRIIPEITGFGLNYESVDVCGGMAGFL